jgi:ESCRT-I complex subunit TSG101
MRDALQQKLGVHCKAIEKKINTESDREDALEKGAQTIARGVKGLQTTQERLEKSIEMIEERDQQLAAWVEKQEELLNSQSELTPEEMLKPSDTMSEQLFECAATVAAIEDVLYHLGRALQNEVIDLKTYLKQVRTLSTKQFLAKALAMKIQKIQTEEHASSSSGMSKSSSGLAAPPSYNSVWEGKT